MFRRGFIRWVLAVAAVGVVASVTVVALVSRPSGALSVQSAAPSTARATAAVTEVPTAPAPATPEPASAPPTPTRRPSTPAPSLAVCTSSTTRVSASDLQGTPSPGQSASITARLGHAYTQNPPPCVVPSCHGVLTMKPPSGPTQVLAHVTACSGSSFVLTSSNAPTVTVTYTFASAGSYELDFTWWPGLRADAADYLVMSPQSRAPTP